MGNMVAAFSPDTQRAAVMAGFPSSAPQIVARVAGGEDAQHLIATLESAIEFYKAGGLLENSRYLLETIDSAIDLGSGLSRKNEQKSETMKKACP